MPTLIRTLAAAAVLSLLPATAMAECTIGPAPQIPNGAKATQAEMTAAQDAIRAYVVETQEFLACLEAGAQGRFTPDVTARYNEATDRMTGLALEMSTQLRSFKSRG